MRVFNKVKEDTLPTVRVKSSGKHVGTFAVPKEVNPLLDSRGITELIDHRGNKVFFNRNVISSAKFTGNFRSTYRVEMKMTCIDKGVSCTHVRKCLKKKLIPDGDAFICDDFEPFTLND